MLEKTPAGRPHNEPCEPSVPSPTAASGPDAGAYVRQLICISCPLGCQLTVSVADGAVTAVSGNSCPRGEAYGRSEVLHPVRTVTTTVDVADSPLARRLSVKTAEPLAKERVADVIASLADTSVRAPVRIGDIVVANVADTGVDVVATSDVLA